MSVYVDDMHTTRLGRYGRMRMSHMIADSRDELMAMADAIGLDRGYLQRPGTHLEHFDVGLGLRRKAVTRGAVEITMRELAARCRAKLASTPAEAQP